MLARRWIIIIVVGIVTALVVVAVIVSCVLLLTPAGYAKDMFTLKHFNDSTCAYAQPNWVDVLSPYPQGVCFTNPIVGEVSQVTRSSPTQVLFTWQCFQADCTGCADHETLTINGCSPTAYGGYIHVTVTPSSS